MGFNIIAAALWRTALRSHASQHLLTLTLLIAAPTLGLAQTAPKSVVEREAYLMGTLLRARVWASSGAEGFEAIESGFAEVRRLDGVLNSWREDSELSALNASLPGQPMPVSAELFGYLQELQRWRELSGGAFDPAVGALVDAWGLRGVGRRPSELEVQQALVAAGHGAFKLDETAQTVTRMVAGARLTAGGFGKGVGLRALVGALRMAGIETAFLDFGGQVQAVGRAPEGVWRIGIAHPLLRTEVAALIRLSEGSAATSGASERNFEIAGQRVGHILDPRSGKPVSAWGSVTVVALDPVVADVLSTALYVMGPEEGLNWAESWEEIGALFLVLEAGGLRLSWNAAMEPFLEREGRAE
ncbi:MAG: FAD:protein FMN transferase [Gemmatimonadota bacterium]|nr:MAG: FAD:protein FMN transferase [Gemmatimonadota bacterium]